MKKIMTMKKTTMTVGTTTKNNHTLLVQIQKNPKTFGKPEVFGFFESFFGVG